eukprot:1214330-Rhodomonas_salina.1
MELRALFSALHVSQVNAAGEHAQHFSTLCRRLMTEVELHVFNHKNPAELCPLCRILGIRHAMSGADVNCTAGDSPVARFRFGELEFYWQSRQHHADFFTHCDEMQKRG